MPIRTLPSAACAFALLSACLGPRPARAASTDDAAPGAWFEVPDSKLEKVVPDSLPEGSWSGFQAIMGAWSGGAFDTKRDRLIVWGGGHHDYSGNEVYVFSLDKLAWTRLTDPSADVGGDEPSGEYPDGKPRSRHTYNYIQYVPSLDRFCTLGGAGLYPSGQTSTNATHCFDFEAAKWERKGPGAEGSIGGISGVDEAKGKVYLHTGGGAGRLLEWDPPKDTWTRRAEYPDGWFAYTFTGAVGDGMFLALGTDNAGKTSLLTWDLAAPDQAPRREAVPASVAAAARPNPGFAYDSKRNLFVTWAGGPGLWAYSPATRAWMPVPLAPGNRPAPAATGHGTFGRFRYSPARDVFIGVNAVSENVWLFRMPENLSAAARRPIRHGSLELGMPMDGSIAYRSFPLASALVAGEPVRARFWDARSRLVSQESRLAPAGDAGRWIIPGIAARPGRILELSQGGRLVLRGRW